MLLTANFINNKMMIMKYSIEKLKELYEIYMKNTDDIINKYKYNIYKYMWIQERRDLNSKWSKQKR